jgi:hypothetical protein
MFGLRRKNVYALVRHSYNVGEVDSELKTQKDSKGIKFIRIVIILFHLLNVLENIRITFLIRLLVLTSFIQVQTIYKISGCQFCMKFYLLQSFLSVNPLFIEKFRTTKFLVPFTIIYVSGPLSW